MAYATPHVWAPGETPSHTNVNQDAISNPTSLRALNDLAAKVFRTSNQSISANSTTSVTWQSAALNVGSMWSAGSPTRLTVPQAGIYLLTVQTEWALDVDNRRGVGYRKNGGGSEYKLQYSYTHSGTSRQNGAELISLAAGDYIEVRAYQDSIAGALNLVGSGEGSTSAELHKVGELGTAPPWTAPRDWSTGDKGHPWRFRSQWGDNAENLRHFMGAVAHVSLSKPQAISPNSPQAISWDVLDFGVGSVWTAEGSQLRAPVSGYYMLIAGVEWDDAEANAGYGVGYRASSLDANVDLQLQPRGDVSLTCNGKAVLYLPQNEYVEVYASQSSTDTVNARGGGPHNSRASLHLIAAVA